jgi:hypothetical protein
MAGPRRSSSPLPTLNELRVWCSCRPFAKGAPDADRPGALSAQDFDEWLKAIDNWGEGRSLTYFNPSRNDGPVYRQLYATLTGRVDQRDGPRRRRQHP